ncbi:MAG: OsmC family protein [Candidatus Thorarchaeota archaeon]
MAKQFKATLERTTVPEVHHITLGGYQSAAVCAPPELTKHPGTTTPHQLFLASVGSCVNIIFEIACGKGRIEVLDLTSEITGDYEVDEETQLSAFTAIYINTKVTVSKDVADKKVRRLFEIAVNSCPIGQCLVGSCVKLIENLEIIHK